MSESSAITKMIRVFAIILAAVVYSPSEVLSHPGRNGEHEHINQAATIVKLKNHIRTMEDLLSKQEHRLTVGFDYLRKKVSSMEEMAERAEKEFTDRTSGHTNCALPLPPPYGRMLGVTQDATGAPQLPATGVLYFVCEDGFHLHGSESRTCMENGTWSGDPVTCVDISFQIAACVKLNCQNGGTCQREERTEDIYRCSCPDEFYGKKCQKVRRQQSSSNDGDVIRANCVSQNGKEICSCVPGYQIGPDRNLCFDIDECAELPSTEIIVIPDDIGVKAKRDALYQRPTCRHQCVNTPGSFHCTCPSGYTVDPEDDRECKDIDECRQGLNNCTQEQHCFNTGGGFKCVELICPPDYFAATSFVCQRNNCAIKDKECLKKPITYSYNFIDLPPNMNYPADVFRLVTNKESTRNNYRFTVLPGNGSIFFKSRKMDSYTGMLVLQKPMTDSATVDFEMKELTNGRKRRLVAKYVYRITFFQSTYDYR